MKIRTHLPSESGESTETATALNAQFCLEPWVLLTPSPVSVEPKHTFRLVQTSVAAIDSEWKLAGYAFQRLSPYRFAWAGPSTKAESAAEAQQLFLDHVVPAVLGECGENLFLHAGGIDFGYGTIALIGPTQAGKSTLVFASLQAGAHLVGDDTVLIVEADHGWRTYPSYPFARLRDSAQQLLAAPTPDLRLREKGAYHAIVAIPAEPLALILLERGDATTLRVLPKRLVIPRILASIKRPQRATQLGATVQRLLALIDTVPAFALTVGHGRAAIATAVHLLQRLRPSV